MRHLFATFVAVLLLGFPWFASTYPKQAHSVHMAVRSFYSAVAEQVASVIMAGRAKTVAELRSTYDSKKSQTKVRVLLVPGHEPGFGGTSFDIVNEREIVVSMAEELAALLQQNPKYEVFVTRDNEVWKPEFESYFRNQWNEIIAWKDAHKRETAEMIRVGQYQNNAPSVDHITALTDVALRLYGINKWAQEKDIDIVIHIHLNDYPRSDRWSAGEYSGFSIYVPESQYYNSTTTRALAKTVFSRLLKYNPISDYPPESSGIVEDQELIAVGSYNTVDAASMLIEYGYIYEPQFINPEIRPLAVKDLAYQTYIGLLDFFDPAAAGALAHTYDTLVLPHEWKTTIAGKSPEGPDVFALQTALILDGVYPPVPMSKNDCPRSGRLGACTKKSLDAFQKKHGINDEKEIVGTKTIEVLNRTYGTEER
jgi:N-acetylmuramoyl-L-alanine amidase